MVWERKLYQKGKSHWYYNYNYQNNSGELGWPHRRLSLVPKATRAGWHWLSPEQSTPGCCSCQALLPERWSRLVVCWDLPPSRQAVPDVPGRGTSHISHLQPASSLWSQRDTSTWNLNSVSRNWKLSQCCQQKKNSVFESWRTLQQRSFQCRLAQFFIYSQRFLLPFVCW